MRSTISRRRIMILCVVALAACVGSARADGTKKVLLIGQGPDDHPPGSHEYMAGLRVLEACLSDIPDLEVEVVEVGETWPEGAEKIRQADGVVLYLAEGAKWVHADVERLEAMAQLATRGGGIAALHWGIGTQHERYVEGFLKLLGGCHGGPDRQFIEIETELVPASPDHMILRGVEPLTVLDEFYYDLKFIEPADSITPILHAKIDEEMKTVAWAWERSDGGRSFGFSGLHFHANWSELAYRRVSAQAVLWTVDLPIPEGGLPCEVADELLALPTESP